MKKKPLLIAHRGASAHYPENTLPAFQHAAEVFQADWIELDIRLTRDGVPVVSHDDQLERTTNGSGNISELPYKAIAKLDAGYHFDPRGCQEFPMRDRGFRIPTLEKVLEALPKQPLAIEIKEPSKNLMDQACQMLEERNRWDHVMLGSKHHFVSQYLDSISKIQGRFASRREITACILEHRINPRKPKECPGWIVSIPPRYYGFSLHESDWIEFLHKKKVQVFFWTIDDAEMMLQLAQKDADGIVTNNLETARNTFVKM